jgi:hypothetical protein
MLAAQHLAQAREKQHGHGGYSSRGGAFDCFTLIHQQILPGAPLRHP